RRPDPPFRPRLGDMGSGTSRRIARLGAPSRAARARARRGRQPLGGARDPGARPDQRADRTRRPDGPWRRGNAGGAQQEAAGHDRRDGGERGSSAAGLSGGGDLLSDRGGAGTWRSCRPVHHVDRAQLLQRAADPGSHRVRAPFRRDRHSVPETWAAPPCERRCGRTSDQSSAVEVLADVRQLNGAVAARDAGGQERVVAASGVYLPRGLRSGAERNVRAPECDDTLGAMPHLLPEPAYFASLPKVISSGAVILRDEHGMLVIEKPNYRDHWLLPGGSVDAGEDARQCAQRELHEELGLDIEVGRMLTADWVPSRPARGARMGVHFLFDAGVVPRAELQETIVLQREELDDWRLMHESEAEVLSPWGAARTRRALAVLRGEADVDLMPFPF